MTISVNLSQIFHPLAEKSGLGNKLRCLKNFSPSWMLQLWQWYQWGKENRVTINQPASINYFISSQILWVLTLFFALGLPLGASALELHSLLITIIGYILYSVVYLSILSQFIFKVDNLNKHLKRLKVSLEQLEDEGENMTKLIREIDNLEPVSGYGLFTMDRTTL